MNTISSPTIDRDDLVNFISKSQEYIDTLRSIISIQDLEGLISNVGPSTPEEKFSPEALRDLEKQVSQVKVMFENDSTIIVELPGKPAVEYNCKQMGFRSQETKTWKMLIEVLSNVPHTLNFGVAFIYPDGSRKNRQKCKDYDAKWKLLDELNKKLLVFFKREFNWNFPNGYKFYKIAVTGNDGDKVFKFMVECPSSKDEAVSLASIEERFQSLDESDLVKEIVALNDDYSLDSCVHNDPPEFLIAALNVGRNNFDWHDEKVMKIIQQ